MTVYIILGAGFEEIEAVAPFDILKRGGVKVSYRAAGKNALLEGAHGIRIEADGLFADAEPENGDYIVIPGGIGGVNSINADSNAMALIKKASESGVRLAAICAGPSVLARLRLLDGKRITCYPGCEELCPGALCDSSLPLARDGSLITGRAPGAAIDFALRLLAEIAGEKTAGAIAADIYGEAER